MLLIIHALTNIVIAVWATQIIFVVVTLVIPLLVEAALAPLWRWLELDGDDTE